MPVLPIVGEAKIGGCAAASPKTFVEIAAPERVAAGAEGVDTPGARREVAVAVLVVDRRILAGGVTGGHEYVVAAAGNGVDGRGRVDPGVSAPGPPGGGRPVREVHGVDASVAPGADDDRGAVAVEDGLVRGGLDDLRCWPRGGAPT